MARHLRNDFLLDTGSIDSCEVAPADGATVTGGHFASAPAADPSPVIHPLIAQEPSRPLPSKPAHLDPAFEDYSTPTHFKPGVLDVKERAVPSAPAHFVTETRVATARHYAPNADRFIEPSHFATGAQLLMEAAEEVAAEDAEIAAKAAADQKAAAERSAAKKAATVKKTEAKAAVKVDGPSTQELPVTRPTAEAKTKLPVKTVKPVAKTEKRTCDTFPPQTWEKVATSKKMSARKPVVPNRKPLSPGLTHEDERWLSTLLDAFDSLELDSALNGANEVIAELDSALRGLDEPPIAVEEPVAVDPWLIGAIPNSLAGFELGEPVGFTANPELDEWMDRPVLERLKPQPENRPRTRRQLAQSGANLVVALALTYMTFAGHSAQQPVNTDDLASASTDHPGGAAASRGGTFVSTPTPTPVKLVADQGTPSPSTTTTAAPKASSRIGNPLPGGKFTSPFGKRVDPVTKVRQLHAGLDFSASTGTDIHAAADGKVTKAGWQSGYGNYTCIDHGSEGGKALSTCYGHQSKISVKVGQTVKRGDVIGKVGSTGQSTGPHLHFEIRFDGTAVDPKPYIDSANAAA